MLFADVQSHILFQLLDFLGKSLREIMCVWLLEWISANGFVLGYRRAVAEWQLTCWTTLKDDVVVVFSNSKWAYFFILFVLIFDITTVYIYTYIFILYISSRVVSDGFFWMCQILLIGYLQVKFQKYPGTFTQLPWRLPISTGFGPRKRQRSPRSPRNRSRSRSRGLKWWGSFWSLWTCYADWSYWLIASKYVRYVRNLTFDS